VVILSLTVKAMIMLNSDVRLIDTTTSLDYVSKFPKIVSELKILMIRKKIKCVILNGLINNSKLKVYDITSLNSVPLTDKSILERNTILKSLIDEEYESLEI
jgi:hypothetical protein